MKVFYDVLSLYDGTVFENVDSGKVSGLEAALPELDTDPVPSSL